MFNHEAYQRRLDEIKEEVRTHLESFFPDRAEAWTRDISLRYGRFLAKNTLAQLQRAVDTFAAYEHVADKQRHREYSSSELMGVITGLHAAAAMVRGSVLIADPIGAEAMMRIYEEVNGPQTEARAAHA